MNGFTALCLQYRQIPGKIMITYDNYNPLANLQTNPTVQGDERVVFSGSQKERRWDLM
jgi:hypothetical protein